MAKVESGEGVESGRCGGKRRKKRKRESEVAAETPEKKHYLLQDTLNKVKRVFL